jgi:hypothetical protein
MLKCLRLPEQQDVVRFLLLVSKAQFYNYLQEEFSKEGLIYTRDEVKDKVFTIFFEKNHHTSKEKRIFQNKFPNVDKAFSVLRMSDYNNFVCSLQRMESYIILDVILERLTSEFPDMVAMQIFDNVVTSDDSNDIKNASKIMDEELIKFTGIAPVLKVEAFSEN